jgi:hypothetical protein
MSTGREMPRYQSHKTVHALKIRAMELDDQQFVIVPEEAGYAPFKPDPKWVTTAMTAIRRIDTSGNVQGLVGGYYVVYDDGYTSWSPAKAFEEGYRPLD